MTDKTESSNTSKNDPLALSKAGDLIEMDNSLMKDPKLIQDRSADVTALFEKTDKMLLQGQVDEALEEIVNLEKKARLGNDSASVSRLCCYVIKYLFVPKASMLTAREEAIVKRDNNLERIKKESKNFHEIEENSVNDCIRNMTLSTRYHVEYIPEEPKHAKKVCPAPLTSGNTAPKRDLIRCCKYFTDFVSARNQMKSVVAELVQLMFYYITFDYDLNNKTNNGKNTSRVKIQENEENLLELPEIVNKLKLQQGRDCLIGLLQVVLNVIHGKMFVELERARLVLTLALLKEADGDIEYSAGIIQDVQVEIIGHMEKLEKSAYILEQMRFVLLHKDYIRLQILSKKMSPRLLKYDDMQEIKVKYYSIMAYYHIENGQYLELAKIYGYILDTEYVANSNSRIKVFKIYLLVTLLCESCEEKTTILKKIVKYIDSENLYIPQYRKLADDFLTSTLVSWPLENEQEIKSFDLFLDNPYENGGKRFQLVRKRVIENNICVIGQYYSRIYLKRICALCNIDYEEAEKMCCELVNNKKINAKIDRPAGIIVFNKGSKSLNTLDSFVQNLTNLLDLTDEATHLIHKERTVFTAKTKKMQYDSRHSTA